MDADTKDAIHNLELAVKELANNLAWHGQDIYDVEKRLEELERHKCPPVNWNFDIDKLSFDKPQNSFFHKLDCQCNKPEPQNSSDDFGNCRLCRKCTEDMNVQFDRGKLAGLKLVMEWDKAGGTMPCQTECELQKMLQREIAQLEKDLK